MGGRVFSTELERTLAAPPGLVWAVMADTNRWDRAVGMNPSSYAYELLDARDPSSRARVGRSAYGAFRMAWVELGEWIEGRSMWGERSFVSALVSRAGFRFTIEPAGDAARVRISAYVAGRGLVGLVVCLFWKVRFWTVLGRYLDAVERTIGQASSAPGAVSEPLAARANRVLVTRPVTRLTSGAVTMRRDAFDAASARFAAAPVEPELRARLIEHLRERPDEELRQLRPYELAAAWSVDRRSALRAFLHAVRAGLVDLAWQLTCPTCRVAAGTATSIERVGGRVHCDECDIAFDVDFAGNVEAVFQASAAIRTIPQEVYCAGSPWFRPHVLAMLRLEPRSSRRVEADLPRGTIAVRALGRQRRREVAVDAGGPWSLDVRVCADEVTAELGASSGETGGDEIELANDTDEVVTVLIERASWTAEIVLGSVMLTMPEFLDLFAADAPASGLDLSVGSMTVLFSDLVGSTALYEELGDARAFRLVHEHFRALASIVERHDGAVLKTMGDSVMATFASPADAVAAGIEMVEGVRSVAGGASRLTMKIGLHEGPCLLVRANGRVDVFGATVNLASRLQHQAEADRIVVAAELLAHAGVERVLHARRVTTRSFSARLRGMRAERSLVAITPAADAPARDRASLRDSSST